MPFTIAPGDLTSAATRELLRLHLQGMHDNSPPGQTFALDLSGLLQPDVTVWSVRRGQAIAGIGALKALDRQTGELKSMRTHPAFLRQGVAALLLEFIIAEARQRDYRALMLETGSGPAFEPALALYRQRGFADAPPFGGYEQSDFNQFLTLSLR